LQPCSAGVPVGRSFVHPRPPSPVSVGTPFKGWWTTVWPTIEDAIVNATAPAELAYVAQITKALNPALWDELAKVGGPMYAQIGALAYRQTLAATKLTINNQTGSIGEGKMWNFLKEISTNGDMQTMDVVYPASPMLLYADPELLRLLLVPVLNFANNGTGTPFTNPFSPHQIGTYPIADATTQSQEPMPMENTGNMFLMLAGIIQRQPSAAWLKPFMPMLTTWADYLVVLQTSPSCLTISRARLSALACHTGRLVCSFSCPCSSHADFCLLVRCCAQFGATGLAAVPSQSALHRRLHRPAGKQHQPRRQGHCGARGVRAPLRGDRWRQLWQVQRRRRRFRHYLDQGGPGTRPEAALQNRLQFSQ